MAVRQNAIDFGEQYPQTTRVVHEPFYVDYRLTGGDTIHKVTELQRQLQELFQELFAKGGFVLRKWNTSATATLKHVSPHLLDEQTTHEIVDTSNFVKVLGVEWNTELDCFRPMIGSL